MSNQQDHRPWGFYEVLSDQSDHKVKRISVYPGKRSSLQRHRKRSEHWHLIRGKGLASLNGQDFMLRPGDSIDIPQGATHRILNPGDEIMAFIEVQLGEYFGEDDIERLEDDYGRV